MTNLFVPSLRAHMLSAAVGSGKTKAAVAWIASPSNATRNVLYVAPTQLLIEQTERTLRDAIGVTSGRNVHLIHAGNVERGFVRSEALQSINDAGPQDGLVQLITTSTFLDIVSQVSHPERWSVILDEAFQPATFETFALGADAVRGWEHFSELFTTDPNQGHRILPREGRRSLVEEVGAGNFGNAGGRFKGLEGIARAVANPAIRCELVMTDGATALVQGQPPIRRRKGQQTGVSLQFASYVDPGAFSSFQQVLFLSALFEQTILYHLWTRALGVTFEEHRDFPVHLMRDTHKTQGRFLAVGHLLHRDDNASLENLQREAVTGKAGPARAGARVIDHLIQTAAREFGGEAFLLQTNKRFGYVDGAKGLLPGAATVIPTVSHGLNSFQGINNVAALAVTNPNPQQTEWIRSRTGMSPRQVTQAFRIASCYQALGRCSIRKAEPTTDKKVVLVCGSDDARFIHDLFPGSHWLGQVGTLPSLKGLQKEVETKEPGKTEALALVISQQLQALDSSVVRLGSKTLKATVEALLPDQAHLIRIGAEGQVGIPPQTWQRALSQACVIGQGWQKRGHSLHRITAELYGFSVAPQGLQQETNLGPST